MSEVSPTPAAPVADEPGDVEAPRRSRKRLPHSLHAVVASAATALVAVVVFFLLREGTPPAPPTPAQQAADPPQRTEGVITFAREGDACRQVILDNSTGRLRDNGSVPCGKPATPEERLRERYSGGRIDSIRDSFRAH